MTDKEQAYCMLKDFIRARKDSPWTASWFEQLSEDTDCWQSPRRCIERLGGMEW